MKRFGIVFLHIGSLIALMIFCPIVSINAMELKLLSEKREKQLTENAQKAYQLALESMDKVLYEKALTHFVEASDADSDNVYLRFIVIQLAKYLGDTRDGDDAIDFYDIAIDNMRLLAESPYLNAREKERAQKAVDEFVEFRDTVPERDKLRDVAGLAVIKRHVEQSHPNEEKQQEEQRSKDRIKMKERFRETLRQSGTFEGADDEAAAATTP